MVDEDEGRGSGTDGEDGGEEDYDDDADEEGNVGGQNVNSP
jgi:hypothetical protein